MVETAETLPPSPPAPAVAPLAAPAPAAGAAPPPALAESAFAGSALLPLIAFSASAAALSALFLVLSPSFLIESPKPAWAAGAMARTAAIEAMSIQHAQMGAANMASFIAADAAINELLLYEAEMSQAGGGAPEFYTGIEINMKWAGMEAFALGEA